MSSQSQECSPRSSAILSEETATPCQYTGDTGKLYIPLPLAKQVCIPKTGDSHALGTTECEDTLRRGGQSVQV